MWGVIINPQSGKKALRAQRKYLFKKLRENAIPFVYEVTAYAGHAIEIAHRLVDKGIRNLLILGGDGTVSEVINGIFSCSVDTSEIRIAIVPRGTGNDWARYWGLNRKYKEAIDVFLHGKEQMIDIGKVSYTRNDVVYARYFINSVGFGLDCRVVQLAHVLKYYLGSHALLYFFALLKSVFTYKPQRIKVIASDIVYTGKILTMNIGNGCFSGGGIRQNPDANPTDGVFHAMFVKKVMLKDIIQAIPRLFDGRLADLPFMQNLSGSEFHLGTIRYLPFEADGIVIDACGPYDVSICPNALRMIIP